VGNNKSFEVPITVAPEDTGATTSNKFGDEEAALLVEPI
jgi:hypothetical protein